MKVKKFYYRVLMRVRCEIESMPVSLEPGKVYEVLSVESGWYHIVDETNENYLYPPKAFSVVEPDAESAIV